MSREESQESDEELDRAWQAQVALQLMEQGLEGTELGALDDDDDEEAERLWALLQERNVKENAMAEEELQLQRLREMNAMLDSNPQEDDDGLLDDASEHAIAFEHLTFDTAVAEGSFGRLFKGEYLGVDVAIKNLFMSDDTEEDAKYLAREISALKGIRHPNVVAFIGVCIHETGTYIVTEWIPNGDLTNELRKEKTISWHKRISYAKDAAAAMAYLHARNIIHRDLKAENLLLTDNDSVKVCDLGFARTSKAKRRLSIAGTQLYMAPEVIVGAEYDEKCDIFSYGVVLFEIIARQPPPRRTLNESFSFNQEALWGFRPEDCPTDFWQLMVDCIKETPGERPAFEQILSRLKNLLKQVPKPTVDQANGTGQSQATNGLHDEKHVAEHQARGGPSPSSEPSLGSNEQMGLEKLTHMKNFWETKTRSELITNIVDQEKQLRIEKENMERAIREQVEREYALKMDEERRKMREQMQRELEEARLQIQRERERASQRKQPTSPPASSANPTTLKDDRIKPPASSPATHAATTPTAKPNSKTEILDPVKMERKIHKLQEKIKNLDATFEGNESQKDEMMGRLEEKILSLYDSAARLDALQPAGGRRKITEHSPSTTPTTTTHVGPSERTVSPTPIATPAVPSVSLSQPPKEQPSKEQPSAPKEPLAPSVSPTTTKPVASKLSDVPKRQAETPTAQTTSTTSEPGAPVTKWRAAHEPWKAGASTHTPKIQSATPSVPATAIATTTTTTTPTASTSPSSSPRTPARSAAPEKPDGGQQGDKDDRKDPLTPTKMAKDGERERERAKEKEKKRLTISKKMKHSLLNLWERENLNEAEQKKVIEKRKNTLAKRPNNLLPRTQEEISRYKLEMIAKYEREKRENDNLLLQRKQGTSAEKPSEGSAFGQHRSFRLAVVPSATTKSTPATDSGKGL